MNLQEKERALIEAGEKLGKFMAKLSDDKKKILNKIRDDVEKYAKEMEAKGSYTDKSSIYANSLIRNEELGAENDLIEAAKSYIDADYEYMKSLQETETSRA